MTADASVGAALRSAAPLVVVEAPAGCGKTHQGAEYALDLARSGGGRALIVTHTHAACSVFAARTSGIGRSVEIRTVDSLVAEVAGAYHAGLGLPQDVAAWTRRTPKGHVRLSALVAKFVQLHPMVAASVARRYPAIICDEHQDTNRDQHALIMALLARGSAVRLFGDPMQRIFREDWSPSASEQCDWETLRSKADVAVNLETPHRWRTGCPDLGRWTLAARDTLKSGGRVDLTGPLPGSVRVIVADNVAEKARTLRFGDARPIYAAERDARSLLVLTRYNEAARSCRGMFSRRLPLWEGHARSALERLVADIGCTPDDPGGIARAAVDFLARTSKGFTRASFGDRLEAEARGGCTARCRGRPAEIQRLASFIVSAPDHRGVARMLRALHALKADGSFTDFEIDHVSEYWDAVHLGEFENAEDGLGELTARRAFGRKGPASKAISSIHKAKGLECGSVILMPADAKNFPDRPDARCLLYVALSRAKDSLTIVTSRREPSPLLAI